MPVAALAALLASSQLMVVTTDGWDASRGTLRRYERHRKSWRAVGEPIEIFVGENGLAWGRGLHPPQAPRKKEGDRRSPAGLFRVGEAVGRAAREARIPYRVATENLRCVDDPRAKNYNRIVEAPTGERMRDYALAIVVAHNQPAQSGAGSCIFLHQGNSPTVGCTAMDARALDEILAWLDATKRPLIVQLPREVHARVAPEWGLPGD